MNHNNLLIEALTDQGVLVFQGTHDMHTTIIIVRTAVCIPVFLSEPRTTIMEPEQVKF